VQIATTFPHAVRTIPNTWIELGDGTRLAARIWLPEDAEADPVPAILEYIPYRKGDATAARDAAIHPYFAGHGYAAVRVDQRGSGDSDGIMEDEYLLQEQDDGLEVIAWIAAQPWCTGAVGMMGKSWGGFNGLQIAARRPPALKAVITVCSTDNRYADDVHYMGGCVLAADMLGWASTMLAYNARPPDPAVVGERWREQWLDRLERTPAYVEAWLSHQRRDAYWQHGSVCEDFSAIEAPVYAVGGWTDAYSNAIPRLLAGLSCPRKGLIGPWGHNYPHDGVPGPAIGFLQECLRWWHHWLKGEATGVMDEPMLRAWMEESVEPRPYYAHRPGRWITEPSWPPPGVETQSRPLPGDGELTLRGSQATGLDGGAWCGWGNLCDLPVDQRAEDGRSLCFEWAVEERLEILGFPEAVLRLSVDRPVALVAVRLCDVAPDGASTLVTRGLLNLTHRDSHEFPEPLEPGRPTTVRVRLNAIAHAFPPGHRIRLAVSPTYWPLAWPSPEPVTLTLLPGESALELPVRPPRDETEPPPFAEPETAPPLEAETLRHGTAARELRRDVATGRYDLVVGVDFFGSRRLPDGLEYDEVGQDSFTIVEGDPLSAAGRSEWRISIGRDGWQTRVETSSALSADAEAFHVTNAVDAYEGNARVFAKAWTRRIPRDLV
jgi:predicted acyl esterase